MKGPLIRGSSCLRRSRHPLGAAAQLELHRVSGDASFKLAGRFEKGGFGDYVSGHTGGALTPPGAKTTVSRHMSSGVIAAMSLRIRNFSSFALVSPVLI